MQNSKSSFTTESYVQVIRKILLKNGVKYIPGKKDYFFRVNTEPWYVRIDNHNVSVIRLEKNISEHFLFTSESQQKVLDHYVLKSSRNKFVDMIHSEVVDVNGTPVVIPSAAKLEMYDEFENCANKIIFFSDKLVSSDISDTLHAIHDLSAFNVISMIRDVEKPVQPYEKIIDAIYKNEFPLKHDLQQIQTR